MKEKISVIVMNDPFGYKRFKRYNNVKKSIVKFLLKYDFCFTFGVIEKRNAVETKPHCLVVYLKPTHLLFCETYEKSDFNDRLNKELLRKLNK